MESLRRDQDFPPCGSSSADKEEFLHKRMLKWRATIKAEGNSLLKDAGEKPYEEYAPRMEAYLKDVSEQNKSSLVEYVIRRKTILDILEKAMSRGDNEKYSREEVIHTLITPRWKDSNHMEFDDMNLWLIIALRITTTWLRTSLSTKRQLRIRHLRSVQTSFLCKFPIPQCWCLKGHCRCRRLPLSNSSVPCAPMSTRKRLWTKQLDTLKNCGPGV